MGWVANATRIVLAETAHVGLPEAAPVAIAAFDPFLRGAIRRRYALALARAEERTRLRAGDHLLRVAFLLEHPGPGGAAELDLDDERAVGEAFDALVAQLAPHLATARGRRGAAYREAAADRAPEAPEEPKPKRPRRAWPITAPLGALLGAALVATAVGVAAPSWSRSPEQRFRATALGRALDEPLTDAVVGACARATEGHAELGSRSVERQIGAQAQAELQRVLTSLPGACASTAPVDVALAPVFEGINAFNARLHEGGVPALLHGYARGHAGARSVWLTSYFVERREELTYDGEAKKTAWGRRLDTLNLADSAVYKANAEDFVVVSLDALEETFVDAVLPAMLQADAPPAAEPSPRLTLRRAAERAVGKELRARSGASVSDAEELSSAIARRNLALEKTAHKAVANISLRPSERKGLAAGPGSAALRLDDEMFRHRRKLDPAIAALVELVEEGFVARVHDEARFQDRIFPGLGGSDRWPRSRASVSAQLGAIARGASPHLALWMTARAVLFAESAYERPPAETTLRLVLKQLGALPASDDGALAEALVGAFELDAERLRAAAAAAYEAAFVAPPPKLVRRLL